MGKRKTVNLHCLESVANSSIPKYPWLLASEPSHWGGAHPTPINGANGAMQIEAVDFHHYLIFLMLRIVSNH